MKGSDQPDSGGRSEVSRREALQVIGGATAGAVILPRLAITAGGAKSGEALGQSLRLAAWRSAPSGFGAPSLTFQAIRTQDMLYLGFEFYNAHRVVKGHQTYVVRTDQSLPMIMVVVFPSQHLGEQTNEVPNQNSWPDPPLPGALAGVSWLAFEVPKHAEIPLTVAGLLSWAPLRPHLQTVVTDPTFHTPTPPFATVTALEVPWSLWVSPHADGTWHHATSPVSSGGRTELWHTRLGTRGAEPPSVAPKLMAFWSRNYDGTSVGDPWLMPLDPQNRADIVSLTTGVVSGGGPALADFFALSALGASIDVHGSWNPPQNTGVSLAQWVQRTSLGRDTHVRVVNLGYLFPFGNRAVKVTVTDRQFQVDFFGVSTAYLVTTEYIVVTEPVLTYTGDPSEPFGGRGNPIRQIHVKTLTTGPIDFDTTTDPGIQVDPSLPASKVLWVRSGGQDVAFAFTATDFEGRTVDFTTSVIWLDQTEANFTALSSIISDYGAAGEARNTVSFGGALFAFAETNGAAPGSTAQHVDLYNLTVRYAQNGAANFYPMLGYAVIRMPGAEQLAGSPLPAPTVSLYDDYVSNGFAKAAGNTPQTATPAEIFLQVVDNAPGLNFPVNLTGGMAAPNFDVSGIARDLGPVGGDLADLASGIFDPSKYFSVLSGNIGKLLGAIPITEIIEAIDPDPAAANAQAPKLSYNLVYPNNDKTKLPTGLEVKLTWNPKVTGINTAGFFEPNKGGTTNFLISADITVPISNPANASYAIHGELTHFEVVLFGNVASFIGVTFSSLTFDTKTGSKTSVQPKIDSVSFMGPLTFIQDLENLLTSIGGPSIDVTAKGITASYSLPLPDVSVGVFSLTNLSISAGLTIPFDSSPVRVRFALCSQDNPFLLTIYVFGGGGYFSLAIGMDGIEELQVELEFGAAVSIDIGVASGGVSIMAGIYFSLQTTPTKQVQLTGFLRADGNLSVLGIITLSMEFYLALTYLDPGQAYGEATVTVSISVLFFSTSVSATYRKTLGGGSDPDFRQAISQAAWDSYCEAFAA